MAFEIGDLGHLEASWHCTSSELAAASKKERGRSMDE